MHVFYFSDRFPVLILWVVCALSVPSYLCLVAVVPWVLCGTEQQTHWVPTLYLPCYAPIDQCSVGKVSLMTVWRSWIFQWTGIWNYAPRYQGHISIIPICLKFSRCYWREWKLWLVTQTLPILMLPEMALTCPWHLINASFRLFRLVCSLWLCKWCVYCLALVCTLSSNLGLVAGGALGTVQQTHWVPARQVVLRHQTDRIMKYKLKLVAFTCDMCGEHVLREVT